jgi:hypothetical protein
MSTLLEKARKIAHKSRLDKGQLSCELVPLPGRDHFVQCDHLTEACRDAMIAALEWAYDPGNRVDGDAVLAEIAALKGGR